jgi:hypothetical protein
MALSSMPTGAKYGAAGVGGLATTGLLYRLMPGGMFFYIMIGMALVGLLLGLLRWLLGRMKRRKAKPMEKSLKEHGAATPQGLGEPARRARLDDLRKNFESGVEKFRAAGKNIYSLPWYVLVGEPGSGKTEAIRHCNVGFPPGLQDQLQGVGGTINMNWWFTNHAIILDTAGRLMFEEVEPGATSEWREFLRLLRANRPNCPINGMLLVIPADSLIKDTADQLERKGAQIAQQLDQIQRALGVRFPVFVVITKCDLINGFREFFDDLTDPQLQHQILGWSNPASLDESFNPELVDQHLQTVVERLTRRRMGLLLDPVNTEDPSARRTDQVDALYAFPQALTTIAPRLRRYLEMVFVAGEWSAKPLFLRGIYFTSSMREGSALDADLAEVLGVPVESLPEGRVWERERAYFLRDLFMNKVFREKGLVTNATNAKRHQRRRKFVVLAAGFLSVLLLAGFTWWGLRTFHSRIGDETQYWKAAADKYWSEDKTNYWRPIVYQELRGRDWYAYGGGTPMKLPEGKTVTTGEFHEETMKKVQTDIHVPWIFRFAATFSADINSNRQRAQRILYEAGVLRPLVDAVRKKMAKPDGKWSAKATASLAQLVALEAHASFPPGTGRIDLNSLFDYVLRNREDYDVYKQKDRKRLDEILQWTYAPQGGQQPWPPPQLWPTDPNAMKLVDAGVGRFTQYWEAGGGIEAGEILGAIAQLRTVLDRYGGAEADLLAVDDRYEGKAGQPGTLADASNAANEWRRRLRPVNDQAKKIEGAVTAAKLGVRTLVEAYRTTIDEKLTKARDPHNLLIRATGPPDKAPKPEESLDAKQRKAHLQTVEGQVKGSLAALKETYEKSEELQELRIVDSSYLDYVDIKEERLRRAMKADRLRLFAVRLRMYHDANGVLAVREAAPRMAALAPAVAAVEEAARRGTDAIDDLEAVRPKAFRFDQASGVSRFIVDRVAKRRRIHTLLKGVLENAPKSAEDVAAKVTEAAQDTAKFPPKLRPVIEGTRFTKGEHFPPRYHPKAATATFRGWSTIWEYVKPPPDSVPEPKTQKSADVLDRVTLKALYDKRQGAYNAYLGEYQKYWREQVLADLAYQAPSWAQFQQDLIGLKASKKAEDLEDLGRSILEALGEIESVVPVDARPEHRAFVAKIRKSIDRLGKGAYLASKQIFLENWQKLGTDATAARGQILPKTPAVFVNQLMVTAEDADTDLAEKYWKELGNAGLRLLAQEIDVDVNAAFRELARFSDFPLGKAGERELTPERLEQARAALDRVLGTAKVYESGQIGGGARTTKFSWIDAQLDRLCGLGLAKGRRGWCLKVKDVLAALPRPGRIFTCEVLILPVEEQTKLNDRLGRELNRRILNAHEVWRTLRIFQGGERVGAANTTTYKKPVSAGKVEYPAKVPDTIVLRFYRNPSDAAHHRMKTFTGPKDASSWAALRLLQTPHARVAPKGVGSETPEPAGAGTASRWHVVVLEEDGQQKTRGLWLELSYKAPLPLPTQWPGSPPGG